MPPSSPKAGASLASWLAYIEALHPVTMDLGLERIARVAQDLDCRPTATVITVGGTNGKGSVCALLEAMLLAAGYRTGCYTSPHLVHYNERIRINGAPAQDSDIVTQFERIEAARKDTSLSYFEFSTLAALGLFTECALDVVILEVGLGGRLDAVNIIDADCAVITNIAIDHSAWLGNTRNEIAGEKAHIFRTGRPAICADLEPPERLLQHARDIRADLWLFTRDFSYTGDQLQWAYQGRGRRRSGLAYPALRGSNQLLNACAALAALESLEDRLALPQQAIRQGLAQAQVPGRFQVLAGQPIVILDVAHNPHAAQALAHNMRSMPAHGKTYAVLGMLSDKDIEATLMPMLEHVDYWLCATLSLDRGLSAQALAKRLSALSTMQSESHKVSAGHMPGVRIDKPRKYESGMPVECFSSPTAAFREAQARAAQNDRILVFGSFATVGPVLASLERDHTLQ